MKKTLLLILIPFLGIAQTQIGSDINGEAAIDQSGYSISTSADGTIIAVGAPFNTNGSGFEAGHVRVYQNVTGVWLQIGADIDGELANDSSGHSVSLSADGTTLAIGAPYNDGNGSDSGHVRIYKNISGTWTQVGADINGEAIDDLFGYTVSLSADGSILAVGAPWNDGNGPKSGHTRIFQNIAGVWTQIGTDINGEATDDWSGWRVSLSANGSIVAIGALYNDGNGLDSGHVRVYQNIAGVWTQIGADINGESGTDLSGYSVSLSATGTIIAIGGRYNDGNGTNSGHVRVYQNSAGTWTQIGADINGEAANDQSGLSVSLSADGTVVAIGAPYNDGNGTDSGHVRIYKNNAGTWIQKGTDINGEATGDLSGLRVSLAANNNTVLIGAPYNAGNGTESGQARVYDLTAILSSNSFVQANFIVYPNPTSDVLTIELQNNLELQKVTFYNTLGQVVKTATTAIINVADLAKGNYYVEVLTNQGKATKTIIVE